MCNRYSIYCITYFCSNRFFKRKKIDLILSPAVGGIIIGYEIGRILNIETIFAERMNGSLILRRDFKIKKDSIAIEYSDYGGKFYSVITLIQQ